MLLSSPIILTQCSALSSMVPEKWGCEFCAPGIIHSRATHWKPRCHSGKYCSPFQQTPEMLQCVPRQCPGQRIRGQEAVSSNSALTQYMGSRSVLCLFNKYVSRIPQWFIFCGAACSNVKPGKRLPRYSHGSTFNCLPEYVTLLRRYAHIICSRHKLLPAHYIDLLLSSHLTASWDDHSSYQLG